MSPPDFVIAGFMRSGTTMLHECLARHPKVCMSDPKEPHFFARNEAITNSVGPGDEWFTSQLVLERRAYDQLWAEAGNRLCGESSATYIYYPDALKTLKAEAPEAKVIIIVRDPVARVRSTFDYLSQKAREDEKTVSGALDREPERIRAGWGPIFHYLHASKYGSQLRTARDIFGPDLFLVHYEALVADPLTELMRLEDFLGLPHDDAIASMGEKVNASHTVRSRRLARLLYPPDNVRATIRRLAPDPLIRSVQTARRTNLVAAQSVLDADTRNRIRTELGSELDLLWSDWSIDYRSDPC